MYEDFYSMQDKAFPCQPTPSVFFESPIHEGASFFLLSGIEERETFLLVTGNYGMGKTLLCLRIVYHLAESGRQFVDLPTPVGSYRELLELLLIRRGIHPTSSSEESLQLQFLQEVQRVGEKNESFIILLDEVQDYQISMLGKIRMLSNCNVNGFYPLQFVLFSHPSIKKLLAHPSLEPLDQRIRRRFVLQPFTLSETKEYIYFRLLKFGASGRPYFPDETISLIQERSGGIPRKINNICDACMLYGAANNLETIDLDTARAAIESVGIANVNPAIDLTPPYQDVQAEQTPPKQDAQPEQPSSATSQEPETASTPKAPRQETNEPIKPRPIPRGSGMSPPRRQWLGQSLKRVAIWVGLLLLLVFLLVNREAIISTIRAELAVKPEPEVLGGKAFDTEDPFTRPPTDIPADRAAPQTPEPRDASKLPASNPPSNSLRGSPIFNFDTSLQRLPAMGEASGTTTWQSPLLGSRQMTELPSTQRPATTGQAQPPVASFDGQAPYTLLVASFADKAIISSLTRTMQERGIPRVYNSEMMRDTEGLYWAAYQGAYASYDEALAAKSRYALADATVKRTPYTIAIPLPGNSQMVEQQLLNQGLIPYQLDIDNQNRLCVGAYQDRAMAEKWQAAISAMGLDATVIQR